MTPLTGMTALEAAEELRRRLMRNNFPFSIALTATDAEHLASLLEHGARGQAAPEPGELVRHLMRIPHAGDCPAIRLEVDDRRCTCGLHASVELARSQEQRIRELEQRLEEAKP